MAYVGNVPVHSTSADARIMVVDLADGTVTNVSTGLKSARWPAWAPAGSLLAFQAVDGTRRSIFVCRPDGSGRRDVGPADTWSGHPCFLDAEHLVFLTGADRTTIDMRNLQDGTLRHLTKTPRFHSRPTAAPDGAALVVFASEKLAGPGDLFRVNRRDGTTTNLTRAPALYSVPAFSPDGKNLIFSFDGTDIGGARRGVAGMPAVGGKPTLLAQDGYPPGKLCFSPSGDRIAYTSASGYHTTWVNLMKADGGNNQRIHVEQAHIVAWPDFTADGTALVYYGFYGARCTVRLLDLKTGKSRNLCPGEDSGTTPECSPPPIPGEP